MIGIADNSIQKRGNIIPGKKNLFPSHEILILNKL